MKTSSYKIMKTQPRQHISNKYNTFTVVTSPVYIGSQTIWKELHLGLDCRYSHIYVYIVVCLYMCRLISLHEVVMFVHMNAEHIFVSLVANCNQNWYPVNKNVLSNVIDVFWCFVAVVVVVVVVFNKQKTPYCSIQVKGLVYRILWLYLRRAETLSRTRSSCYGLLQLFPYGRNM